MIPPIQRSSQLSSMKEKLQIDLFRIKIIGAAGTVLLMLAWSGIFRNTLLSFALGFLGSSSILIFGFALNEAVNRTRSLSKYMLRILILAVICAFPYFTLYRDLTASFRFSDYLSGPFTVFFGIGSLYVYDRLKVKWMKTASVIVLLLISVFLGVEYAPFCLIYLFFIHCYSSSEQRKYRDFNIVLFSAAVLAVCLFLYFFGPARSDLNLLKAASLSGSGLGLPVIRCYSGDYQKSGKSFARFFGKYFFYALYPSTIIILAAIKYFLVTGG